MDFSRYSHLWNPPVTFKESREAAEGIEQFTRRLFLSGVGRCLGGIHSSHILYSDAHLDNFVMSSDFSVAAADFDEHTAATSGYFRRDITSEEYAYDLIPILEEVSRPEWDWFKLGYLAERQEQGAFVINLIERGTESRAEVYDRAGKYEEGLKFLLDELNQSKQNKSIDIGKIYSNIGYFYSKLGDDNKAIDYYDRSRQIALHDKDYSGAAVVEHNIGMAYQRKHDLVMAIKFFETVRERSKVLSAELRDVYCDTLYCLMRLYRERAEWSLALQRIDELISLAPGTRWLEATRIELDKEREQIVGKM